MQWSPVLIAVSGSSLNCHNKMAERYSTQKHWLMPLMRLLFQFVGAFKTIHILYQYDKIVLTKSIIILFCAHGNQHIFHYDI